MQHLSLATGKGSIIINKKGFYVFDGRSAKEQFNDDWKEDYTHLENHKYIDITAIRIDPDFSINGITFTESYCAGGVFITLYCDIGTPQKEIKKAIDQLRHERDVVSLKTINVKPFALDLDRLGLPCNKAKKWLEQQGYNKGTHDKFKVGQAITFMTGYHNDILAKATIKGIDGDDLYVYSDCYWFPIREEEKRKINIL